jgi:hypothetical protein
MVGKLALGRAFICDCFTEFPSQFHSTNAAYSSTFQPFKAYVLRDAPTCFTFNNCTFCPHCVYLRTNSDVCHLHHKLIGFYNRDEKCLQRGTDWVFKYSSVGFVFKGLILLLLEGQSGEDWEPTKKATLFRMSWNFGPGNLQTRQGCFEYPGTLERVFPHCFWKKRGS